MLVDPGRLPKTYFQPIANLNPTLIVVQAVKSKRSPSSHGVFVPTHVFSGDTHLCHSHLRRNAQVKRSRSRIPSHSYSLGKYDSVELTLHFPPEIATLPAHKNRFRILSSSSSTSLGGF